MVNMQQNNIFFQDVYSKLINRSESDNPKTLMSNLADIICGLIENERDNLFYFSMPIWDYLNNCWEKDLVVRINPDNEKNKTITSDINNWITESNKGIEDSTYKSFFNQAGKKFSFIEFVTQHVRDISPLFTIEYSDANKEILIDDEKTKLSCPSDIGESYDNLFIEQTLKLFSENKSEQQGEKTKKLNDFREFLSGYKACFPKLKYIYLVSSRLYKQDNGSHIGSGGVIFVCKNSISDYILQQISVLTNLCYRELGGKNWAERCRKESIKSAIAAIMSRNMSHNLGSHFISNTKNYFDALIDVDTNNEAVYRGVKYALQYIQERMDFIATITSNDVYPFGAVNAKAQIFDELTPDDLGKRHDKKSLNFLMDYLVLSEKVSKNSYNKSNTKSLLSEGDHELKLLMGYENQEGNAVFWNSSETSSDENQKRDELVNINFAIPGGVLGRHALFSIVENVIRNAAKHGQDKITEKQFVIKMLCTNDGRFVIFDNKRDGEIQKTVKNLRERLSSIQMLNDDNTLNQDNKGLKEILICAAWLQNENITRVLVMNNFDDYVKILAVDENGKELENGKEEGYLGYSIRLDRFAKVVHINKEFNIPKEIEKIDYAQLKGIKADIVCACEDYKVGMVMLSQIFPRFIKISIEEYDKIIKKKGEAGLLRMVVEKNCKISIDNMQMVVSSDDIKADEKSPIVLYGHYQEKSKNDFLFKTHAGKSKWSKFDTMYFTKGFEDKYIDSISGGDFTHTIVQPSFVNDEYNLLKVYESVKTRFVIIDERIFEQYHSKMQNDRRLLLKKGIKSLREENLDIKSKKSTLIERPLFFPLDKEQESKMVDFLLYDDRYEKFIEKDIEQQYWERKGVFIFNFDKDDNQSNQYEMKDLSLYSLGHFEIDKDMKQVKFNGGENPRFFGEEEEAPITFLTIHLGLIDKIKDGFRLANKDFKVNDFDESSIVGELKEYFEAKFVSIHSGRGGLDVCNSLKKYVFQSYSALENPLHNSKFLLAQQFNNLKYYGSEE